MDMSGWLTVAPRLESVNGPAAFLPCCKKFKLMWHSGHVGARHARWFMPLISSRGHFKWKHREFANFTAKHCRGKKVQQLYTWRDSQRCWEEKQRRLNAASVKNMRANYLLAPADDDPKPTATQTQQRTQKRIYVITISAIWIVLWLNVQSNKGREAEGNCGSQGC